MVLTVLNVPAGGIIGAVLGSAAMSAARDNGAQLKPVRVIGLVLPGLILAQLALATVLWRWFRVDAVTALLAAVPGGRQRDRLDRRGRSVPAPGWSRPSMSSGSSWS
jgi:uncharacterized membrane protein AbrB (regulator of aidB expression)